MNELKNKTPLQLRICSTEIAERTGKRHDNVIRDIRAMLKGLLKSEEPETKGCEKGFYTNSQSRETLCYYLDRRHAECLATGYDVKRRMKIIDFFLEQQQPAIPQTFSDALRLAADEHDKRVALEAKVEEDRPKVEFHDAVTASESVCQLAVACQLVDGLPGRNRLFARLREDGVLIDGGERHDRSGITYTTHVTQKGIAWLRDHYTERKAA